MFRSALRFARSYSTLVCFLALTYSCFSKDQELDENVENQPSSLEPKDLEEPQSTTEKLAGFANSALDLIKDASTTTGDTIASASSEVLTQTKSFIGSIGGYTGKLKNLVMETKQATEKAKSEPQLIPILPLGSVEAGVSLEQMENFKKAKYKSTFDNLSTMLLIASDSVYQDLIADFPQLRGKISTPKPNNVTVLFSYPMVSGAKGLKIDSAWYDASGKTMSLNLRTFDCETYKPTKPLYLIVAASLAIPLQAIENLDIRHIEQVSECNLKEPWSLKATETLVGNKLANQYSAVTPTLGKTETIVFEHGYKWSLFSRTACPECGEISSELLQSGLYVAVAHRAPLPYADYGSQQSLELKKIYKHQDQILLDFTLSIKNCSPQDRAEQLDLLHISFMEKKLLGDYPSLLSYHSRYSSIEFQNCDLILK